MTKMIKTFLTDSDGLSQRDFLLVIFSTVFLGIIVYAVYSWATGVDIKGLLSIIDSMSGIVITIVGGVFGLNAIEKYKQPTSQDYDENNPTI